MRVSLSHHPKRTVDTGAHAAASCVRGEPHTHSASLCIPLPLLGSRLAQGQCVLAPLNQDGLPAGPAPAVLSAQAGPGAAGGGQVRGAPAESGPVAQEQGLERVLAEGRLRVLCWDIEHKKRIQEIDELQERHWDVLCLQEVHNDFQASGHIVRRIRSHNGQVSTAIVVHKRLSPLLVRWGGVHAPLAILKLPGKDPQQTIGIASVYLPTHGRRSGADRPDEVWARVLPGVENDIREAQALSTSTVIAGDWGTSNLAGALQARHFSGASAGRGELEADSDFPSEAGRRVGAAFHRTADVLGLLPRRRARILLPRGGFAPTFVPWNTAQEPKTLDYVAISEQSPNKQNDHLNNWDSLRFILEAKTEAILATAHHLLALHISLPSSSPVDSIGQDRSRGPMRYARLNRRRKVRRRWPEWREMHEGQLASRIPEAAWNDPSALQRAIRWAARASAPKGRLRIATPFDHLERRLSHDRRVTRDREARKVLSRWVLSARAWQRRWRFEQELTEMTAQKKNMGKRKRQASDLLLRDPGTLQARVEAFQTL